MLWFLTGAKFSPSQRSRYSAPAQRRHTGIKVKVKDKDPPLKTEASDMQGGGERGERGEGGGPATFAGRNQLKVGGSRHGEEEQEGKASVGVMFITATKTLCLMGPTCGRVTSPCSRPPPLSALFTNLYAVSVRPGGS